MLLPLALLWPASAHPGADDRLAALAEPGQDCDAGGWLAAAYGLAEEGRRTEAFAAVARAQSCGVEASALDIARARVLARMGPPDEALAALDAVLDGGGTAPLDLRASRGHLLAEAGYREAAVADLRVVVAQGRPTPDDAVRLVDLLAEGGDPTGALEAADAAIGAIGPAPALVDRALHLELDLGRPIAAIARLDGLPALPMWLDRRAIVLAWSGDARGAVDTWIRARSAAAAARPTPAQRALVRALDAVLEAW